MMAVWRRGKADKLLPHWDQSSQYTSEQFQRLKNDHDITCPMNRSGNVWEFKLVRASGSNDPGDRLKAQNAAMESFFSSLAWIAARTFGVVVACL